MKKLTKKEKVLLGVSVVSVGALGILGYKYINSEKIRKDLVTSLETVNKTKNDILDEFKSIKEDHNFLKFLVIESDCIPRAKQNGENKLARKETKMKELLEMMEKFPGKKDLKIAYDKHAKESDIIRYQLSNTYKIEELINNDENIYAK